MGKVNTLFKCRFLIALVSLILCASLFAQTDSSVENDALSNGYDSFRNKDYSSASIFLRQAVTEEENCVDSVWYMIILSEMYQENYKDAVNDCDYFEKEFGESDLLSSVMYNKGKALHCLGQNDSAVLILSDFCHQHPDNEMYPSALFWLGECFYDDFNYDTAKDLYQRVISDFPNCAKYDEAVYKLDLIEQYEREQKLLYLLKITGEEYLSSKENYEKQLKEYQTEDIVSLKKELAVANTRIKELEDANAEALNNAKIQQENAEKIKAESDEKIRVLQEENQNQQANLTNEQQQKNKQEELKKLKQKAALMQLLIEQKSGGK